MKHTSRMRKLLFVGSLILPMVVGIEQVFATGRVSIKLFDAIPTFNTGPTTSPAEALSFASKQLILDFKAGDTAVISSKPDGTGDIVIDNFLSINLQNACIGVMGQVYPDACFGPLIADFPSPEGVPITDVLTPIPPINVSRFIPLGRNRVLFELRDYGVIAGNTDLFLVTTSAVNPPIITPPDGPDLIVELGSDGAQTLVIVVRNIGNESSGETTAFGRVTLVKDGEQSTISEANVPVPGLSPGERVEVGSLSTEGCPSNSGTDNFCLSFATVDQVRTSEKCLDQDPPKEGVVCETDERNNFIDQ